MSNLIVPLLGFGLFVVLYLVEVMRNVRLHRELQLQHKKLREEERYYKEARTYLDDCRAKLKKLREHEKPRGCYASHPLPPAVRWDWGKNELTLACGAVVPLLGSVYSCPTVTDADTGDEVLEVVSYDMRTQTCYRHLPHCDPETKERQRIGEYRNLRITPRGAT